MALTILAHVFVEPDAGAGLCHDRCKRCLADLKRIASQVVAIQLDQVEGVEEYLVVSALVTDQIERGHAVVIAGNSFAVDDARAGAQPGERINDQRKAIGEVIARTTIQPHLCALLARNDAETIVFDFVQPLAAGWQFIGFGWKAWRDEPGGEGAHTQHNAYS